MKKFIIDQLTNSTVGSIINTEYFINKSPKQQELIHKYVKDKFLNNKNYNSYSQIDFNTIDIEYDEEYKINSSISVFKDELDRNLIAFISKDIGLCIHSIDDKDFHQTIKLNVYPYHRVFYYKDVLNLNNIKDYIIVSYIDSLKYNIYKLIDNFYSLFKVVLQEGSHLVIIPCETNKNYMFTFNKYVNSELRAYEFENENDPFLVHKIHDI